MTSRPRKDPPPPERAGRLVVQTLIRAGEPPDPRVDAVELRLDLYPGIDVERAIATSRKPVIATVRRQVDGGAFVGSEVERAALLARAAGAAYLDVEVDAPDGYGVAGPRRIVSAHDMLGVPDDLDGLFQRCLQRGADLVKIAVTPRDATEAFRLLALPISAIGMGRFGEFTRALAPLTYCASEAIAPGIPSPAVLFDELFVRRARLGVPLFGVAGDPIGHSKSPALHNAALARDGSDAIYLRFCVSELAPFWDAFLAHGGRGLSITAPLKEQAAALGRDPDEDVLESGAANTLLADGRAFNTDVRAFLDLVPAGIGPALVLGAGGAARAAVTALRRLGYAVRVHARDPERARRLGVPLAAEPTGAPLVVNATPAEPPPADLLIDLRYGPGVQAPAHGIGGLEFLEAQARHQYGIFFGRPYPEPLHAAGVLLVGPRAAGKTTVGARLAEALGWPFVDADHAIELAENESIAALLASHRLRAVEAAWFRQRLQGPPCVLAAGGGAVCWDGLAGAAAGWKTIWLDAPAEVLAKRLLRDPGGRPSLTGRLPHEEIASVRDEREALYRDVSLWREDTASASPEKIVRRITARLLES